MNIAEIEDSEIAKIESEYPIVYSKLNKNISYEWFYLEIERDNLHTICILSLKDCFEISNSGFSNPSVYLTCYLDNKLVAYSYSIFSGLESQEFVDKVVRWLNLEERYLDLWLPDHSLKKCIHLNLENPNYTNSRQGVSEYSELKSSKKHFWQFLNYNDSANGIIQIYDLNSTLDTSQKFHRKSKFYDYPLSKKLAKSRTPCFKFQNASLYFDHNFGIEPLYNIKNNWYWWHAKDKDNFEVSYYFPKIEKMYYIKAKNGFYYSKILPVFESEVTLKKSLTLFGIYYPKEIHSLLFKRIIFNKPIESAPFYFRVKALGDINSTLEVLNPKKIIDKWNQFLLSARKIIILKNISKGSEISSQFNFSEICKKITFNHGKSFYISSLVLPNEQRSSSYFIYTLCRLIDDATDEKGLIHETNLDGTNFSSKLLDVFWSSDAEISDEFIQYLISNISFSMFSIISYNSALDFILNSRILIKNLGLEKIYFQELINGQLMDENFSQPSNIKDFNLYCYRVAGVVGIMMSKIFRTQDNQIALNAADKLGCAMQITNILRDVKEDFANERIYIPKSLLQKYRIIHSNDFFSIDSDNESKMNVIKELANLGILYYCESLVGIKYIPSFRARMCVKLMIAVYGSILGKIMIDKSIIFKKRIVISLFKKIIIFLKILFGFHPLKVAKLINEKEVL